MAQIATGVAAAGDHTARLYEEYGPKLVRFCRGRLRSVEEAEDAVQATFLRVYTALRQGTVPEYEGAWLYKIAHNVCLSRIESSARRSRFEDPQDFAALEESLAAPEGRGDELVGLSDALATMPPNLRQAILLREWQGLSYAEIAEAMDVSVSAVETLIFRARRHLAKALVEPGKRLAGSLNLPWLWGAVRSFFAGAGAATKVAAGVALLAVGAGGLGAGVAVTSDHAPRQSVAVTLAAASGRSIAGASAAVRGAGARPARAQEISRVVKRRSAPATAARQRPRIHVAAHRGRTGGAAVPSIPATRPGGTPTARTPDQSRPPTTPTKGGGSTSATATTTTPIAVTLPAVTLPLATVPAVTVSVPAVTVTVPTVPTVTTPTIPPVATPVVTVTIPVVTVSLPTPTITLP